ncbi:MAG: nucleotidyl transferase AbiEii/AbiGii toxin family protein [Candidatus Aminicenantes bacterium]|nr:nucleotidyl transferase AbiEii/AbiGii toxin family protein [Candidatus Aminicenantes bacterium]
MYKGLIKRVAADLALRKIPYMIIGGQAVLLYGELRLTKDIDITLGVGVEKLPVVLGAVQALGLRVAVDDVEDFVRKTMVLPATELKSGIRIDFIFSFTPYERQAIEKAREVQFDDVPVRFASLEDVVIHKAVAGRARDIEDIRSILRKNLGYDKEYIRKWLVDFDRVVETKCLRTFEEITSEIDRENER